MLIKIRFNTDSSKFPDLGLPEWRVIIGNTERLAREISIMVPSWTTTDQIETGEWKYHISLEGIPEWSENDKLVIKPKV